MQKYFLLKIAVMNSSWNFPSWAEPSYKGTEPRQAKLGHFNFRAETDLSIFLIYSFFN